MSLLKCKECQHDVSTLALACPNCGAPVNRAGRPVQSPSVPATVEADTEVSSSVPWRALIYAACVAILVVGINLPLVDRLSNQGTLTFLEHSKSSAVTVTGLALIAAFALHLGQRWLAVGACVVILTILSTVLMRLDAAFSELFVPSMGIRVGAYMMAGGAIVLLVLALFSQLMPMAETDDNAPKQRPIDPNGESSQRKALFEAWLAQQGTKEPLSAAERLRKFEQFGLLLERGEVDVIGLRKFQQDVES